MALALFVRFDLYPVTVSGFVLVLSGAAASPSWAGGLLPLRLLRELLGPVVLQSYVCGVSEWISFNFFVLFFIVT